MAPNQDSEFVLGVASVDGALKEVKQNLSTSEMVVADVMSWPDIARVAVFDELLGNVDRHYENLVRRGPRDYIPIDNERIVFGEPFFSTGLASLKERRCDPNILANTITEGTDQLMRQRMLHIARHYVMTTLLVPPPAFEMLEQRCLAPTGITNRLIEALNERRAKLPALMQWHFQRGDLFQASMR